MKDHYKTLGIPKSSTEAEIKNAYRKLAKKMHPDVNPSDRQAEKKFQEISAAYNVLSNKEAREKYDQERSFRNFNNSYSHNFSSNQNNTNYNFKNQEGFFNFDINSLFNMFNIQSPYQESKNQSQNINVKISFIDSILGIRKQVKMDDRILNVRIAPGSENGTTIIVKNKGKAKNVDLNIKLQVESHPIFQRKGHDIYATFPKNIIKNNTAIVPTVYGYVKVHIPNPQVNKIRLLGKGVRNNKKIGNQYINFI